MSVDGNDDAHRGDHEHPGEQELGRHIGAYARDLQQLDAREGGGDGVDRKPSDAEEERERGTGKCATLAEDAPRKNDLRLAAFRSGVAEKAKDHRAGERSDEDRQQAVPNPEPVVGRQQARGQQAGVVDERSRPEKAQLSRTAVALRIRNGVDAVRLNLEKRIRRNFDLCRHVYPSAGITQIRFEGLVKHSTSQRSKRTPLREYIYQYRSSFQGSAALL